MNLKEYENCKDYFAYREKSVSSSLYKRKINVLIPVYSKHTWRPDLFNSSKCSSNERRYYSDIYLQSYRHSTQPFTTDKPKIEKKILISLQRYWKSTMRNFYLYSHTDTDIIYRRKLLSYERNFFGTSSTRSNRFRNRIYRRVTLAETSDLSKRKRNVVTKDIKSNDEDIDSAANWDNWSIWSACSVTCGQGRQVRWRHCLSADCIEGLKKAQLRSCRLKDCSKGFLGWLGIKP